MKISVQTDNLKMLNEAVGSNCNSVRYGSEFCEYKIPSSNMVEKAYEIVRENRKEFVYVTPAVSNSGVEEVRRHLTLLNEKKDVDIVINDLGVLNMIGEYKDLCPRLGRQLTWTEAIYPWTERLCDEGLRTRSLSISQVFKNVQLKDGEDEYITVIEEGGFFTKRMYNEFFSTTSLDYTLLKDFYKTYGVKQADVDFIPRTFPSLIKLVENGFNLSVYLHLSPVTLTRKCHTARFLDVKSPEECSMPCLEKAFLLKSYIHGLEMFLLGNTVFSFKEPERKDLEKLQKINVDEIVLMMNPITGIESRQKIDDLIHSYS